VLFLKVKVVDLETRGSIVKMKSPIRICLAGFIFAVILSFFIGNAVGFACGYHICKQEQH
jgi:hypothetical protein